MNKYFMHMLLAVLSIFIFAGCSHPINPQTINSAILPKSAINMPDFMASKTYSTYDRNLEKITMYHFKNVNGELKVSTVISYIPFDFYHELYTQFSDVTLTLQDLTGGQFTTLEGALENEAARNHYTRLFKNKNEFIIGNNFAFKIQTAIRRYKEWIQNYERDTNDKILKLH